MREERQIAKWDRGAPSGPGLSPREESSRRNRRGGHAVIEVALMAPWIFFLFIAVFDFGFYAYALISTANAARVAALHTSSSPAAASAADAISACTHAAQELEFMPNVGSAVSAGCACLGTTCTSGPIRVTSELITDAACPDGVATEYGCSRVTVTYTPINLIPLPMLNPPGSITRIVEARVKPE